RRFFRRERGSIRRKIDGCSLFAFAEGRERDEERAKENVRGGIFGASSDESVAPDEHAKSRQREKKTAHQSWRNGAKTKHKSPDFLLNTGA
ncbi:hypothetical protein, partial [Porphyromonas loveana]|uniref:hypothetical protein n=1 Tax=Porphyromonas loveana TaxID=1884669 RepID=UPI001A9C5E1C